MVERGAQSHKSPRPRVLLAAAGVVLVFAITDFTILGRFSGATFAIRVAWAAMLAWAAHVDARWSERRAGWVLDAGAVVSVGAFAALVELTGALQSPMFHWILALPLEVAVVMQGRARSTLLAGIATLGAAVLLLVTHGAAREVPGWLIQGASLAALATYAAYTYDRLRESERALEAASRQAFERVVQLDAEREARVRAEELVGARDAFIAVASHELKTPLTALRLQLQAIQRDAERTSGEPPDWRSRLARTERNLVRLGRLVDSLLDVSLLASKRVVLERAPCDLAEVVREQVAQHERSDVSLTVEAPLALVGFFDRTRLGQVVSNLVDNALKYGEGRPVAIRLRDEGDFARLVVEDHGIGIATEDQQRIFERFERAASYRNYSGFGVGLWVVAQIVEAHGGVVTLRSERGQGTTFDILLPCERASAAQAAS